MFRLSISNDRDCFVADLPLKLMGLVVSSCSFCLSKRFRALGRKKNVISLTFHLALFGSPGGFDLGIQQKISLTQDGFAR
jgi:hypothetical protein